MRRKCEDKKKVIRIPSQVLANLKTPVKLAVLSVIVPINQLVEKRVKQLGRIPDIVIRSVCVHHGARRANPTNPHW